MIFTYQWIYNLFKSMVNYTIILGLAIINFFSNYTYYIFHNSNKKVNKIFFSTKSFKVNKSFT